MLPNTKAFKAHIVATRLKQSVEKLVFEISNVKIRVNMAIGLCSTEGTDLDKLGFEDYCMHALHALSTSLDTPNKRIIRYDETYEKKVVDEKDSYTFSTPDVADTIDEEQETNEAFADFFSCILSGDYQKIPVEFLPPLISQLEEFLEYARPAVESGQKISGE